MADVMIATSCFDWYCYFIWLSRALMTNSEDDVSLVGPTVFNYGKTDELKLVNKRFYVKDFTKSFRCDQICFSYQAAYRKFRGVLITNIANTPVFTKAHVVTELSELQQQGCKEEFSRRNSHLFLLQNYRTRYKTRYKHRYF